MSKIVELEEKDILILEEALQQAVNICELSEKDGKWNISEEVKAEKKQYKELILKLANVLQQKDQRIVELFEIHTVSAAAIRNTVSPQEFTRKLFQELAEKVLVDVSRRFMNYQAPRDPATGDSEMRVSVKVLTI